MPDSFKHRVKNYLKKIDAWASTDKYGTCMCTNVLVTIILHKPFMNFSFYEWFMKHVTRECLKVFCCKLKLLQVDFANASSIAHAIKRPV